EGSAPRPKSVGTREHPRLVANTKRRDREARCSELARPSTEGPLQGQSTRKRGDLPAARLRVAHHRCPVLTLFPTSGLRVLRDEGPMPRGAAWRHPPSN